MAVLRILYLLLFLLLAFSLRWEAESLGPERAFSEFGWIEWIQSALLLSTTIFLAMKARRDDGYRQVSVCMALFFLCLLIREADQAIELWLPHGAWKFFVALPVAAGSWYLWRHHESVRQQLTYWSTTSSFGIMLSGFLVLVYSRLFGQGILWETVMGDGFQRVVKNLAEEGTELLAMGLIFVSVLEFWSVKTPPKETNREN